MRMERSVHRPRKPGALPCATHALRPGASARKAPAILDATLQLCHDSNLVALSLRQVAKEVGIVPTAFYRHFDSIEDLGLALVEESFASLRELLRDVRRSDPAHWSMEDLQVLSNMIVTSMVGAAEAILTSRPTPRQRSPGRLAHSCGCCSSVRCVGAPPACLLPERFTTARPRGHRCVRSVRSVAVASCGRSRTPRIAAATVSADIQSAAS